MKMIMSVERMGSRIAALALVFTMPVVLAGCNGGSTGSTGNTGGASDPLSLDGNLSGKVLDTQSTRGETGTNAAGQSVPPAFDTEDSFVRFRDIMGNPLMNGDQPFPPVDLLADGSFDANGLPVGVDFTLCVDIGKDGDCEVESCVHIAADGEQELSGMLEDVRVDPLTTMVLAKLRELFQENGVTPDDLPFSPAAIVARIVATYTNLFEETGIDQDVVLDEILALTPEQLGDLFDSLIPASAQVGMQMAEGNLQSTRGNVDDVAIGAAKVFLRAGFPIADEPGGLDLSSLAELEGVEATTLDELFGDFEGPDSEGDGDGFIELSPDIIAELPPEFQAEAENFNGDLSTLSPELIDVLLTLDLGMDLLEDLVFQEVPETIVYINEFSEPNRNFSDAENGEDASQGPLMNDYLLIEMARLHLGGAELTVGEVYDLLTDIDTGFGARLTYFVFDPNFFGPPLTVFETADGTGLSLDMEKLFRALFEGGFGDVDADSFEEKAAALRAEIKTLLAGTIPPTIDRLFGVLLDTRLGGVSELAETIRNARVHLPYSRSGASDFFVVADGDKLGFDGNVVVSSVTIDAEITPDGRVSRASYNADGNGVYFLGFTERTDEGGMVELIVRETGSFVHSDRGPVRVSIFNEDIFAPVNGGTFADFVSSTGNFFPGVSVTVVAAEFLPEPIPFEFIEEEFIEPIDDGTITDGSLDSTVDIIEDVIVDVTDPALDATTDPTLDGTTDPATDPATEPAPAEFDMGGGPNDQIFVLAQGLGGSGEPVRVDFNLGTGEATFNPAGRNLLMFLPDTERTGLFALFNESTGRAASANDPLDFFVGADARPDGFGEFFNEGNFDQPIDDLDQFLNDTFRDDGSIMLEDGTVIRADGTEVLPDGTQILPDGTTILPDGTVIPIDGTLTEPDGSIIVDGGVEILADGTQILADGTQILPDGTTLFTDGSQLLPDGTFVNADGTIDDATATEPPAPAEFDIVVDASGFILVSPDQIIGLPVNLENFTRVFGTDVPNPGYDPSGDPFFDDINANGVQDADEPTAPFLPLLFDPADWRSTDIRLYYRRADNGASVSFEDVSFESATPMTFDGVELLPRNFVPRLNAFRYGRPNTALNLLTAFAPADDFNGTRTFNRDTKVGIFGALALINLVMDQVFNVEATVDVDGFGPLPAQNIITDAQMFVAPIGDPFLLILDGFRQRVRGDGVVVE